ncbi:MAG: DsbA family protein [Rickettsiales bacterium]
MSVSRLFLTLAPRAAFAASLAFAFVASPQSAPAQEPSGAVKSAPAAEAPPPPKTRKELLDISPEDVVLGKEHAPITVIEYASLSCSHCAAFHLTVFPKIKTDYVDAGKVKFVARDFPLNSYAVFASQIARCAPKDKFYEYVSALFASQSEWMTKDINEQLLGVARLGGMSKERFDECIGDKESARKIMESRYYGHETLDVNSTPTFFVNGIKYEGGKSYEFFAGVFDKLIQADGKSPLAIKGAKTTDAAPPEKGASGEDATNAKEDGAEAPGGAVEKPNEDATKKEERRTEENAADVQDKKAE